MKAVYPKAQVYTTTAIDKVLAPGGFLARNWETAPKMLAETTDPVRREEIQISLTTMGERELLRPDVAVTMGSADFAVGDNRVVFLIVREDGSLVQAPRARVRFALPGDRPQQAEALLQAVGAHEHEHEEEVEPHDHIEAT